MTLDDKLGKLPTFPSGDELAAMTDPQLDQWAKDMRVNSPPLGGNQASKLALITALRAAFEEERKYCLPTLGRHMGAGSRLADAAVRASWAQRMDIPHVTGDDVSVILAIQAYDEQARKQEDAQPAPPPQAPEKGGRGARGSRGRHWRAGGGGGGGRQRLPSAHAGEAPTLGHRAGGGQAVQDPAGPSHHFSGGRPAGAAG